ncbi:MAG: GTP 3',8-cyclase MoaA [Gammaproteobacteria bacterium]|nr:MAG: GTP 3',8-cyclase MoaA [Gammaproteobacteria bacterium]
MSEQLLSNTKYVDPFGRSIDYIRLSVTDRCDLRCFYCMPKGYKEFEEPEDWLTFDEVERVISAFAELGIKKVRLTGGEPLVRKNLTQLVKQLSNVSGVEDMSLSTNAIKLAKFAKPLFENGVQRLNVSLDSVDNDNFHKITGGGKLDKVIDGLMAAKQAGFKPIKINMVMMRDINDHEIFDMIDFCAEHDFILRLIETMPMGITGKEASLRYIPLDEIKQRIEQRYKLLPAVQAGAGPARYLSIPEKNLNIGFITPMSQHFCETCNRLRMGVNGTLYLCLGHEHQYPLKDLLRAGISDEELKQHLIKALALKPEKHEFNEKPDQIIRVMSATGG